MDVLVTGGTGYVGSHLCAELAERGHDVTALARSPTGADLHPDVDVVAGDVTEYESFADHVEGRDAVVNLVALSPLYKPRGGAEAHRRVHVGGTRNCVKAASAAAVDHFVQMSALDASPDAATAYLRAKGEAEQLVRDSALDWTIVRPSLFFGGEGGEFVSFTRRLTPPLLAPLPGGGKTRFQPLHIEEGVAMIADCLAPEHAGETYEIGGPEVVTMAEVGRLARRAQGIPVTVLPLPMAVVKLGASVGEHVPFFPFGLDQYESLKLDNTIPPEENDAVTLGYDLEELTTLAESLGLD